MKKIFAVFPLLVVIFVSVFAFPRPAFAVLSCAAKNPEASCPAIRPVRCSQSNMCCTSAGMCPPQLADLGTVISNVVSYALGFAGIVLFVILVIGGFKFITSGGDPKAVESAKGTLTSAITGLIIILVSYLILVLIKTLTGVDVTNFSIVLPNS